MSNRGSLTFSPHESGNLISESKSYIPLFWLSLLSPEDLADPQTPGVFEIDRKEAIDRGTRNVALIAESFADLDVTAWANELLALLSSNEADAVGIDIFDLVSQDEDVVPAINLAVEAIHDGSDCAAIVIPGMEIKNPFTGESVSVPERRFDSLADLLLTTCLISQRDLQSSSGVEARELFVGHFFS